MDRNLINNCEAEEHRVKYVESRCSYNVKIAVQVEETRCVLRTFSVLSAFKYVSLLLDFLLLLILFRPLPLPLVLPSLYLTPSLILPLLAPSSSRSLLSLSPPVLTPSVVTQKCIYKLWL